MRSFEHRSGKRADDRYKDHVHSLLHVINEKVTKMSAELDSLVTEVEETRSVIDSAITLIQGIKQALDAAGTDRTKLADLSSALDSKQRELADAIVANSPQEPTP